jgi:hypothetical protein
MCVIGLFLCEIKISSGETVSGAAQPKIDDGEGGIRGQLPQQPA